MTSVMTTLESRPGDARCHGANIAVAFDRMVFIFNGKPWIPSLGERTLRSDAIEWSNWWFAHASSWCFKFLFFSISSSDLISLPSHEFTYHENIETKEKKRKKRHKKNVSRPLTGSDARHAIAVSTDAISVAAHAISVAAHASLVAAHTIAVSAHIISVAPS